MIDPGALQEALLSAGSLFLLYFVLFAVANVLFCKKSGFDVKQAISDKNNAVSLAFSGYLIAFTVIFIGSVMGPSQGLVSDILLTLQYSALGLALLFVAHLINDKLIFHHFSNKKELVEDQNIGTGAVQAGSYIASGLIIAGAIQGEGGGIETALAFFFLGQFFLWLMVKIFDKITRFDLHDEIEKDNYAAGIACSGVLIGLGAILAKAASGDFVSWTHNLTLYFSFAVVACVLFPLFRTVIDKLVVSRSDLNDEIEVHQNIGAAILECCATVGFATVLCFLI